MPQDIVVIRLDTDPVQGLLTRSDEFTFPQWGEWDEAIGHPTQESADASKDALINNYGFTAAQLLVGGRPAHPPKP